MSQTLEPEAARAIAVAEAGARPSFARRVVALFAAPRLSLRANQAARHLTPPSEWAQNRLVRGALDDLAAGRVATVDAALRIVASSPASPIAAELLPEVPRLVAGGARVAVLLAAEPWKREQVEALSALTRAVEAPLDRIVRIASFTGADACREQAMIGDAAAWSGAPLRQGATALADGGLVDLSGDADAASAARLRFAAAWRLAAAPSGRLRIATF